MLNKEETTKLIDRALENAKKAYAPYSEFRVGAVLITKDGEYIDRINIENRAYPSGICAERTAFFKAVLEGRRDFKGIVITSLDAVEILTPCGACRQVISEFVDEDFFFIISNKDKDYEIVKMSDMFPYNTLKELKK